MDCFINSDKSCKLFILVWLCVTLLLCCGRVSTKYTDSNKLFDDLLGSSSGYNTNLRPLNDQTEQLEVEVTFDIVAIIEVDPIKQKFIVNGFLGIVWTDERLKWNASEYDDVELIHPYPSKIWRPRLILANTLEKRDLFEDDYCPTLLSSDGIVSWNPGSLFPTSCKLNLRKYPFDTQTCYINMMAMGWKHHELVFVSSYGIVNTSFFSKSGEWELTSTKLESYRVTDDGFNVAGFTIVFYLKRLPGFFIINIVTPIVLLSFLNILVFLIPVESGEKISYGITVLLALTVFMSIVSGQVPRSSDTIPLVTIYLLVLTIISVCTVIVSIAIVFCHHHEEKEAKRQKAVASFKGIFHKAELLNRATTNMAQVNPADPLKWTANEISASGRTNNKKKDMKRTLSSESARSEGDGEGRINRWKQIGKHLDKISFIVFMLIWLCVTIGFMA